ncbi:MAG: YbhB/YbcL family Raf kinase inhibitor-like protein [Nanopusillaceae archaeon]
MKILDIEIPDNIEKLNVYSEAFKDGEKIPKKYTCDGENLSYSIKIENLNENVKSILIIVEDPDAPMGIFRHWIAYINGPINYIPEGIKKERIVKIGNLDMIQGINDFGRLGYDGPCPPRGHKVHRYYTIVLALNKKLNIIGSTFKDFMNSFKKEDVIQYGYFVGLYQR